MVGDDAHGAAHHQAAGGAEKAADDGIGNETDGAAGAGEPEREQQDAGQRGGERHDDRDRRQEIVG